MKGELTPRGWGQELTPGRNEGALLLLLPLLQPHHSTQLLLQHPGLFTASATEGWPLGPSNTAQTSRVSLTKSWVWGGFSWGRINHNHP